MSKKNTPPSDGGGTESKAVATIEARLLVDCPHGKINQVVELTAEEAARALRDGWADPSKDAVAAAKALSR